MVGMHSIKVKKLKLIMFREEEEKHYDGGQINFCLPLVIFSIHLKMILILSYDNRIDKYTWKSKSIDHLP